MVSDTIPKPFSSKADEDPTITEGTRIANLGVDIKVPEEELPPLTDDEFELVQKGLINVHTARIKAGKDAPQ